MRASVPWAEFFRPSAANPRRALLALLHGSGTMLGHLRHWGFAEGAGRPPWTEPKT